MLASLFELIACCFLTASLTSEDSGWEIGQLGASCDQTCRQLSQPCHLDSVVAINSSLRFNRAVSRLGTTHTCTAHLPSQDDRSPYISGTQCTLAAKESTSCDSSAPKVTRLCCCSLDGCDYDPKAPWAGTGISVQAPIGYWSLDT